MAEHYLVGSEEVRRAAVMMDGAADQIQRAATNFQGAVDQLERQKEDFLQRFEILIERLEKLMEIKEPQ